MCFLSLTLTLDKSELPFLTYKIGNNNQVISFVRKHTIVRPFLLSYHKDKMRYRKQSNFVNEKE